MRYSSWGVATPVRRGDVDGDGVVGSDDLALVTGAAATGPDGARLGDASYYADGDADLDGDIDNDDVALLSDLFAGAAPPEGELWTALTGAAPPVPGDPLSAWCAAPTVGYAGAIYDRATGLWLMRNRWYDPTLGRWLTRDPAGYVDGMSLYLYVSGNPLAYWDPFGLTQWIDSLIDFGAGVSDSLTFGATEWVRDQFDIGSVNPNSSEHKWGERVETVAEIGLGAAAAAKAGAKVLARISAKEAGEQLAKQEAKAAAREGLEAATRQAEKEGAEQAGKRTAGEAERLTANREKGLAGERQAGIDPNDPKKAIDVNGQRRVPDHIDDAARTLTEVKNAQYQAFTRQLRDYAQYAAEEGYKFILKVSEGTKLSGPLQEAAKQGKLTIERCLK